MTETLHETNTTDSLENNTEEHEEPEHIETADDIEKYAQINSVWSNVILGSTFMCAAFACVKLYNALPMPRISLFLVIVLLLIHGFVTLLRKVPQESSKEPLDWIYTILGTWLPFLILCLTPLNDVIAHEAGNYEQRNENVAIFIFQLLGLLFTITAVLNLSSSHGVIPALRPIKKTFLFRLIRHPVYLGFAVTCFCAVIQDFTPLIATLYILMLVLHILCIHAEENFFKDIPAYELYKTQTRKKLIPFIW